MTYEEFEHIMLDIRGEVLLRGGFHDMRIELCLPYGYFTLYRTIEGDICIGCGGDMHISCDEGKFRLYIRSIYERVMGIRGDILKFTSGYKYFNKRWGIKDIDGGDIMGRYFLVGCDGHGFSLCGKFLLGGLEAGWAHLGSIDKIRVIEGISDELWGIGILLGNHEFWEMGYRDHIVRVSELGDGRYMVKLIGEYFDKDRLYSLLFSDGRTEYIIEDIDRFMGLLELMDGIA